MASELRVNSSTNRSGLGTITYTDSGPIVSGVGTFANGLTVDGTQTTVKSLKLTGDNYNANWFQTTNKLRFNDNAKTTFGTSDDLQIYHTGSHSYIADEGAGELIISGSRVQLMNAARSGKLLDSVEGASGYLRLYQNNNIRLETTSTGVTISGTAVAGALDISGDIDVDGHTNLDNVSIVGVTTTNGDVHIGNGDLRFENSAHKIYTASSAHTLTIQGGASNPGGKIEFRGGTSDNDIRFFTSDGSGNSVEKLRIASNGNISITNDLDVDGHTNLDNVSVAGVSTFTGTVNLSTINSTASNLAIHNTADRVLIKGSNRIDIADNTVRFQNRAQNETLLHAVAGASGYVKLYHSNNLVASVTQDALTVTGRTSNSGMVEIASNQGANNNDRFRIHKTSAASRLTIQNYSTGSWVENIIFNSD